MAERVGFEPTAPVRAYLISSQGRYDRFDTAPYARTGDETRRSQPPRPAAQLIIANLAGEVKEKSGSGQTERAARGRACFRCGCVPFAPPRGCSVFCRVCGRQGVHRAFPHHGRALSLPENTARAHSHVPRGTPGPAPAAALPFAGEAASPTKSARLRFTFFQNYYMMWMR